MQNILEIDSIELRHSGQNIIFKKGFIDYFLNDISTGYYFIGNNKLYLIGHDATIKLFRINSLDSIHVFWENEYNIELMDYQIIFLKKNLLNCIDIRLTKNNLGHLYDAWIINLEHRMDRKKNISNEMEKLNFLNPNYFKAIKHTKGYLGCALSHLYLIFYANELKLPFIIIFEDDIIFMDIENFKHTVDTIVKMDYQIFNGCPSYWKLRRHIQDLKLYSTQTPIFALTNWAQSAATVIYHQNSYSKLMDYDFSIAIDNYIAGNFFQTINIKNHLINQIKSLSDITHRVECFYKYYNKMFNITINKEIIPNIPIIGIYTIFIGHNINSLRQFIENFNQKFLSAYKKIYYVVSDLNNNEICKLNCDIVHLKPEITDRTVVISNQYKYFNQFNPNDIDRSDIFYFIGSNVYCIKSIDLTILPNETGYVFVNLSTKLSNKHYCDNLFGATRKKFKELCFDLDINLKRHSTNQNIPKIDTYYNNCSSKRFDISNLDQYCNFKLKCKFKTLDSIYYVPENEYPDFKNKNTIKIISFNIT